MGVALVPAQEAVAVLDQVAINHKPMQLFFYIPQTSKKALNRVFFSLLFILSLSQPPISLGQSLSDSLINHFDGSHSIAEKYEVAKSSFAYYQQSLPLDFTYHVRHWAKTNRLDSIVGWSYVAATENLFFAQKLLDSALEESKIGIEIFERSNNSIKYAWACHQ